ENAMAYDLRPTDWFLWANEELQEIRSGVGKLILKATPQQDGVAILWSQPCLHARDVEIPEASSWPQNVMCSLLQDVGLSYRFITTDQLRAGVLLKEKYRALTLPWAVALDPEEATQIRAFVAQGGTVLADVRPGVMDAHSKEVATGQLDDVFGIQSRALRRALVSEQRDAEKAFLPCYETSLTPVGAKVQPDSPKGASVLVNRFGRGTAILLNLRLDQYGSTGWGLPAGLRGRGEEGPVRSLVARLLIERGIAPPIALQLSSGPQAGVEIKRYRVGELEYVGILSNSMVPRKDQAATINLPRKSHVYDVRQRRYLGKTSEVKTRLSAGSVKLYALLPYLAKSMKIESARRVEQGGTITCRLRLHVQGAAAGKHVFHLEVVDPEGRSAPWFFRNLLAEDGACMTDLDLALNEKPGRWLLKARDIATGLAAERELTIVAKSTTENR
ncbi:MAG: beta-galactosidase trimerization domain-containing protein, partial [Armatimonadetes bacterium]|nr:beta-galactosidase trimerization domain-containing protein [Armatimonadota bacterium]